MKIFEVYEYTDPYKGWGIGGHVRFMVAETEEDAIDLIDEDRNFWISNGIREVNQEYVENLFTKAGDEYYSALYCLQDLDDLCCLED